MKKYLYVFNYPPEDQELCALEFEALFNDRYSGKIYLSNLDYSVNQSVFMKAKVDLWGESEDFKQLIHKITKLKKSYVDFKVIYLKNEQTHVDYQETLDKCRDISWGIGGSVNMNKPKHIIAITKLDHKWYCGYYHHGIPDWKKHDNKPYTFSNSLDIRLARTLVNLAAKGDKSVSIVDPCCGVGTVVLEGLALKLKIVGFDISRDTSWHARKNLEFYGYDGHLINKKSIHDLVDHYDVAIIDLPYNLYTPITYEEQVAIITSSRKICQQLVLVTYETMDEELKNSGYQIDRKVFRRKSEKSKFGRYIYLCH
ncbi:TRM11 family methyltransferase [uncultured Thomasclavelia sp.]|uniref:TRM11 family SAM-dependent methyltransferase n=1 Tax=uncultured Thomasclavelia sp. TaxID=3025759 RepID=UPI0025EB98E9|nr:methyltransferase [uncultured Thomasclavelia sp.]